MPAHRRIGASVEGFDLATGRTLWSVDAGANVALAQETAPPQIGQEVVILLNAAGTPMALNLMNGTESPVPAGATAFCQAMTSYTGPAYENGLGANSTMYTGGAAEFPCSPSGQAVAAPSKAPTFAGPSLDGLTAWSEANQVVAVAAG
jgi:hypothetical protein